MFLRNTHAVRLALVGFALCSLFLCKQSARAQRIVASWHSTPGNPLSNQFPIRRFWDDALSEAEQSGRTAMIFDVDYVDTNSQQFRDNVLANPQVQKYLDSTFVLGQNDFSIDPPPTVGFDSLRNLGLRLSALENRYHIVARPTAILIRPDSTEIDRISFPNHLSPHQFIERVQEILDGRNTLNSYVQKFWSDTTSILTRLELVDQFEQRSLYDSVMKHLLVISNYPLNPIIARRAALKYSYLRLNVEGKSGALRELMATFGRNHADSTLYFNALNDLLEFYKARKRIDSVEVFYKRIFAYTGTRDPDLLNDYAWELASYTKQWDTALVLINEALRAQPRNAFYLDTRALVYFSLHKFDSTIMDEKHAVEYATSAEDRKMFQSQLEGFQKRISGEDVIHGSTESNPQGAQKGKKMPKKMRDKNAR